MRVLDREYQGTVRFRTVEHLEPEAVAAVARYGWTSHGAIAYRGRRVIYRAGDHRVNANDLDEHLRDELGLPFECRVMATTARAP